MSAASASSAGLSVLMHLTSDPRIRARLMHQWSNEVALRASFLDRPASNRAGFEDLAWLFSSNVLNHGLARQEFAEAAYLWKLIRDELSPGAYVAEVGRFTGGTTFLLAAAGARVVSIDRAEARPGSDAELRDALARAGLAQQVELVTADLAEYEPAPVFELVLFDAVGPRELIRDGLERWWDAIVPLGSLIVRDGAGYPPFDFRSTIVKANVESATELAMRENAEIVDGTPGAYVRLRKVASVAGN